MKTRNILDEPQDITFTKQPDRAMTAAARMDFLSTRIASGAPKTDDQKAKPLERYWTKGKGLARWAESPTPFRTLVAQLREEIPAGEMTDDQLHGLAAKYYHQVKGEWPGKKRGDKGSRVASLVERMNAITAAGKQRRVETPEGARHYGQPVGSIIVTDGPDIPSNGGGSRGRESSTSSEDPERVSPAEMLNAAARLDARLFQQDSNSTPLDYDLPAVMSEMNEHTSISDTDLDAILDGNRRPTPDSEPGVTRTYDGRTLDELDADTAAAVTTGIQHLARYSHGSSDDGRPGSAYGVNLDGVDQEKVANAAVSSGLNIPQAMHPDVTPEDYQEIATKLQRIVANGGEAPREDRWMQADYKLKRGKEGIEAVSKQTADDIMHGVEQWAGAGYASLRGDEMDGRSLDQFDMPAVLDEIVAANLNVPYFHTGLSGVAGERDGDWEIDEDTEWPVLGEALWDIMQRHPRDPAVENSARIDPRRASGMSNGELAQEQADIMSLLEEMGASTDWESDSALVRLTLAYGLNVRAGMSAADVDDAVRAEVRARMATALEWGSMNEPRYDDDGELINDGQPTIVSSAGRPKPLPAHGTGPRPLCAVRKARRENEDRIRRLNGLRERIINPKGN